MSFLDVNIIRKNLSVYHKPTFSRIYTHIDSFLPSTSKIGMIHNWYIDASGFAQIGLSFS